MPGWMRRALLGGLVGGLLVGVAWFGGGPTAGKAVGALEAGDGLRWYRGNMHTHSYWSDGDNFLEMIAAWYRDRNYDFLVFTDHNVLANRERWADVAKIKEGSTAYEKLKQRFPDWIDERTVDGRHEVRLRTFAEVAEKLSEPNKFLLIQGEEVSDSFKGLPLHLCAANLKELLPPFHGDSVQDALQNNVNALIAQRERTGQAMMIHLNHPNFGWAVTAEDLMRVRGENFFEVYNGHPGVNNSGGVGLASTERIWDIILTRRIDELDLPLMYGLGVDDGHNYHHIPSRRSEPGRGWVMVLTDGLQPESLIAALEAGKFYASSGVTLEKVEWFEDGLGVQMREEPGVTYQTEFIGTCTGYDPTSRPAQDQNGKERAHATRVYSEDIGRVLKTVEGPRARYMFRGDELYVRARVTSSRKHPNPSEEGEFERAWVQPVYGPAAKRQAE